MRVIEAQCSWTWRLTITPHINQIRTTTRTERPDLRASTADRRGVASRPERRISRSRRASPVTIRDSSIACDLTYVSSANRRSSGARSVPDCGTRLSQRLVEPGQEAGTKGIARPAGVDVERIPHARRVVEIPAPARMRSRTHAGPVARRPDEQACPPVLGSRPGQRLAASGRAVTKIGLDDPVLACWPYLHSRRPGRQFSDSELVQPETIWAEFKHNIEPTCLGCRQPRSIAYGSAAVPDRVVGTWLRSSVIPDERGHLCSGLS